MRTESAVEPTRSENITVIWRRSAPPASAMPERHRPAPQRTQHLSSITEDDTEVFQVLISQVAKDREINAVFGEPLGVLGHAEFFEPVRNLLHRGPASSGLNHRLTSPS
jgi:hypothetical protein